MFAKILLFFDILTGPPILNLRCSSLIYLLESIYVLFYINRFNFNCAMICIIVFIN